MSREPDYLEYDPFDDFDEFDDDNIEEHDCGLMPDGLCLLAGTEFCDWDCGRLG